MFLAEQNQCICEDQTSVETNNLNNCLQ